LSSSSVQSCGRPQNFQNFALSLDYYLSLLVGASSWALLLFFAFFVNVALYAAHLTVQGHLAS